jgi:hypothetical protein
MNYDNEEGDASIVIASLSSRVDELEAELAAERTSNKEKLQADNNATMYNNIIDTLHSEHKIKIDDKDKTILDLQNNIYSLSCKLGTLHAVQKALDNTRAELYTSMNSQYCSTCGEYTKHDSEWCIQCLVDAAKENETSPDETSPDETSPDETSPNDTKTCNCMTAKIIGYQRVIIALTDKLAEAYGVEK